MDAENTKLDANDRASIIIISSGWKCTNTHLIICFFDGLSCLLNIVSIYGLFPVPLRSQLLKCLGLSLLLSQLAGVSILFALGFVSFDWLSTYFVSSIASALESSASVSFFLVSFNLFCSRYFDSVHLSPSSHHHPPSHPPSTPLLAAAFFSFHPFISFTTALLPPEHTQLLHFCRIQRKIRSLSIICAIFPVSVGGKAGFPRLPYVITFCHIPKYLLSLIIKHFISSIHSSLHITQKIEHTRKNVVEFFFIIIPHGLNDTVCTHIQTNALYNLRIEHDNVEHWFDELQTQS